MGWMGVPVRTGVLGATALWVLFSGAGCSKEKVDNSPTGVVKQFIAASLQIKADKRHKDMYKLLGPRTKARLKSSAERATAATGGKRKFAPHEMLSASSRPSAKGDWIPKPKGFKLLSKTETTARVQVRGKKKEELQVVELVKVKGHWRIELTPKPAARPAPRPATGPTPRPAARPAPRPTPKPVTTPRPAPTPKPAMTATPAPKPQP